MDERLYNSPVECPACKKTIEITRVKSKALKVRKRDSDYCTHYEDINPLYYEAWVCEHCGYAALSEYFSQTDSKSLGEVLKLITAKWNRRSFAGERKAEDAISAFKLVLLNAKVLKAKSSELAKICIRIAWIYRIMHDPKEKEFLTFALNQYKDVFENERFPVEKLDQSTCMYIIAELSRRIEDFEEATQWFSRLISSPEARKNHVLLEAVRDQFQLAKEKVST